MAARKKHWLRHPRTQQERRKSQGKNDLSFRSARRANRLPTSYDDQFPRIQKSWKSRRKTRYSVIVEMTNDCVDHPAAATRKHAVQEA